MDKAEVTGRPPGDDAAAAPAGQFVVIVGERTDGGSAFRIEEPDRLLRVWALLQATSQQLDSATLPPEGMPGHIDIIVAAARKGAESGQQAPPSDQAECRFHRSSFDQGWSACRRREHEMSHSVDALGGSGKFAAAL